MMSSVAEGAMRSVGQAVKIRSWKTHINQGHVPIRKDCQICQEAAARDRPHCRQTLPPKAGVWSLDTAGPFERSPVLGPIRGGRGAFAKYILVGTLTWPTGRDGPDVEDAVSPEPEGAPEWVESAVDAEAADEEVEEHDHAEEAEAVEMAEAEGDMLDGMGEADDVRMVDVGGEVAEDLDLHDGGVDSDPRIAEGAGQDPGASEHELGGDLHGGPRRLPQVEVLRMAIPMPSKSQDDILGAVAELYLTLRAD